VIGKYSTSILLSIQVRGGYIWSLIASGHLDIPYFFHPRFVRILEYAGIKDFVRFQYHKVFAFAVLGVADVIWVHSLWPDNICRVAIFGIYFGHKIKSAFVDKDEDFQWESVLAKFWNELQKRPLKPETPRRQLDPLQ
jgi:hypothetical protein